MKHQSHFSPASLQDVTASAVHSTDCPAESVHSIHSIAGGNATERLHADACCHRRNVQPVPLHAAPQVTPPFQTGRRGGWHRSLLSLLVLLMAALCHTSCEKHDPPVLIDYSLKVGNIYCYDGSIIPPEAYNEKKHVPIAVIVAVGGETDAFSAVAVGMDEWQLPTSNANVEFEEVGSGREDRNGKANTAAMILQMESDSTLTCPAADYVSAFQNGGGSWYIPACGELRDLAAVREAVSHSMQVIGGKPFTDEWYLSSSQDDTSDETRKLYMLNVSLAEGRVMNVHKTAVRTVRPFVLIQ